MLRVWSLCFIAIAAMNVYVGIYKRIVFDIHCTSHLKLAADSNTVEMAKNELKIAIDYLEERGLTSGNTSIFYDSPVNDLDFWYKNLKSSYEELNKITANTSQLERTNVLMKLRETILDHGTDGDMVTVPSGIAVYPWQGVWFFLGFVNISLIVLGFLIFILRNPLP